MYVYVYLISLSLYIYIYLYVYTCILHREAYGVLGPFELDPITRMSLETPPPGIECKLFWWSGGTTCLTLLV